jgi:hypothetical protein
MADDDNKLAAEDLARTIAENKRFLEHHGVPLEVHHLDDVDKMAAGDEQPLIHLVVGMRGSLTRAEARRSAVAFRKLVEKHPNACIALAIAGYDRDLREVDEIPEAAEHYIRFARFAGVDTLASAIASPLHRDSIGVLGACGALRDFDEKDVIRLGPPSSERH